MCCDLFLLFELLGYHPGSGVRAARVSPRLKKRSLGEYRSRNDILADKSVLSIGRVTYSQTTLLSGRVPVEKRHTRGRPGEYRSRSDILADSVGAVREVVWESTGREATYSGTSRLLVKY